MRIATWNVNSVRARLEHLIDFVQYRDVDVILLQELKCTDDQFPSAYFEDMGYNCLTFGQKSYNGVGILSRYQIECLNVGSNIFQGDNQARYIESLINGYVISSVYVPNGQDVSAPAYGYKLQFLKTLTNHIAGILKNEKFIIGGDFNIARTDTDVYDPVTWNGMVCCTEKERELFEGMIDLGLQDVLQDFAESSPIYTWWDYRHLGFQKNHGLRLDYLLATDNVEVQNCCIDRDQRAKVRPSDHAPIIMDVL